MQGSSTCDVHMFFAAIDVGSKAWMQGSATPTRDINTVVSSPSATTAHDSIQTSIMSRLKRRHMFKLQSEQNLQQHTPDPLEIIQTHYCKPQMTHSQHVKAKAVIFMISDHVQKQFLKTSRFVYTHLCTLKENQM